MNDNALFFAANVQIYNKADDYPSVECLKMDDDFLSTIKNLVEPKECYNNIVRAMAELRWQTDCPIFYVAGIAKTVIPIDHAWLKIGDEYFDPTYELHNTLASDYRVVDEIPFSEMLARLESNNMRPPSALDCIIRKMKEETSNV